MTTEISNVPGLATRVAKPDIEHIWELPDRLELLNGQAMELAKSIVDQMQDVDAIWEKLLPVLDEVRVMLSKHCSRRRERRRVDLPKWQEWRRSFLRESGLAVCDRTVQRRLKAFRELMELGTKRPTRHSGGTTPSERYQLLQSLQAADELSDALIEGEDPSEALARFVANKISSERLQQMIVNCPKPRVATSIVTEQATPSTLSTPDLISFRWRSSAVSSEIEFKPGGWSLLAEYITVEHREHFDSVFGNLPPADSRQVFKKLVVAIAKTLLHLDDDACNLKISAESVTEDHKPMQAA